MAKPKQPTDPRPPAAAPEPAAAGPALTAPAPRQPAGGAAQKRARQRAGRQAAAAGPPAPPRARAAAKPGPAPRAAPAAARPAAAARPGEPPATVRYAVWLMYAGAALSGLALIITLLTTGQARSLLHAAEPNLSSAQLSSAVHAGIISSVAIWAVTIALWLIMAKVNQAGRGWARIAASVLCVASTLSLAGYITQGYPVVLKVAVVPLWLAGLAATVLLWRPATTSYIRAGRA
jgi:hypothetical protein